ncbi:MAG: toll/interleukin-1 receptor domain-containing protein, partial [Alphaproteobacteria bacterium]
MDNITKPKVFISYSWSSPEYQERIIHIVDALRESGIETVFDKYNLPEGADLNVFMEKIVNDPSITKVLIFCDKQYTEKANSRKGGAGTETLIISPEVYNDADPAGENKKFIPIIMEKDINTGKPYIPIYIASRKYFDFTKQNFYDEFERLVRFLYGKPEYREPALGQVPSYVSDSKQPYLGATTRKELAINALKEGKISALRYCEDFFFKVYETLDGFVIDTDKEKFDDVDDIVWNHINDLLPLSRDCIDVLETIIVCDKSEQKVSCIRNFLEKLLTYREKAKGNRQRDCQSDHFHFFVYYVYINLIKFLI